MTNRVKAFVLRKKISKAGKTYYSAPYGNCDLLGFLNEAGDIEVSYVEREVRPTGYAPRGEAPTATQPQARQASPPRITPRPQAPKIIPRDAPHHRPQPIPQDYVDYTKEDIPWPDESEIPF